MKKLLIGLLAVAVLVVAAILIAPSFVDWNAQKERIATVVREATGRDLTIVGDIEVTVLPRPALRVVDVRFSNVGGAAAPDMVRVQEARVSVAVGSLLKGRPAAVVTLIRPIIHLERLADGRSNWDFVMPTSLRDNAAADRGGSRGEGRRSAPLFDVRLDSFRIINGTVTYLDGRSGAVERVDALSSEISFDSLAGPYRMQSTGVLRDVPLALDLSVGAIRHGAAMPVAFELTTPGGETTLRLRGNLEDSAPDMRINGDLLIESASLAEFAASVADVSPPYVLGQAATIEGRLTAVSDRIEVDQIIARVGNARFTGAAKAELGETTAVTAKFRTNHLDLDHLIEQAEVPRRGTAISRNASDQTKTGPDVDRVAFPATLSVGFEIAADIIQYQGGLIRGGHLHTQLDGSRLLIKEAAAVLPGNSSIAVQGTAGFDEAPPTLELDVDMRSDNLREILEWAGLDISTVPADRLRRFSLATQVIGDTRNLTARTIKAAVDATEVDAGLALILRDRPAFGLRVALDRLNLDGYRGAPKSDVSFGSAEPAIAHTASASRPLLVRVLDLLPTFDANIDASVRQLTVSKVLVNDIHLDFTVVNGGIELRNAQLGDVAGLTGQVSGKLDAGAAAPSILLDYQAEVHDQPRFMHFLGLATSMARPESGALRSTGRIAGDLDELSAEARLAGFDGEFELQGTLRDLPLLPAFELSLALQFPELVDFIRLGLPNYAPAAGKLGALNLTVRADGTPAQFTLSAIDGTIGPVAVRGSSSVDLSGARPRIQLGLNTSEILLDLFLPAEARARAAAPELFWLIPASVDLRPTGHGIWSAEPIDPTYLSSADLDVTARIAAVIKDRYRFDKPELEARLTEGRLALDRFAAGFGGGSVGATGQVEQRGEGIGVSVNFGARDVEISELIFALRDYQLALGPLQLGATMTGPATINGALTTEGSSARGLVRSMNGLAKLSGQLRTTLSDIGRPASSLGIAEAVRGAEVLGSAFTGQSTLNGDFHIDRGVVTTQNTVLVGRGGRALTSGTANLVDWGLSATTEVTLGEESAPYLQVQLEGPLDDPYIRRIGGSLLRGGGIRLPTQPTDTTPLGARPEEQLLPRLQNQRSDRRQNSSPLPDRLRQ